ncbi:hypothetical protein EDC04DRAFT_2872994 [Pisolithus marmoratus]|nr:hypothetical protein EDC04DRAFT_2872994 [Pisolithus marmoratus]
MSPFVRDVGQILLDNGSALRELWAGMNPPKDENGSGGNGTTSRRHSVSVVQPRRPTVVGFNAPGHDTQDESSAAARSSVFHAPSFGRGGLMFSDDDLAADLGSLSLSKDGSSEPASLPIYAPLSRSPLTSDRISPYQHINLNIPTGTSFSSRQRFGSPSDSGFQLEQQLIDAQYLAGGNNGLGSQHQHQHQHQHQQPSLTAQFHPILTTTTGRPIQPQQGPFYPQQMQRRTSDAPVPNLNDLGKGVPLSSVPASWPLYIVEFKAGRTDLFYLTDLSLDIRVGDLVIVEADRGKDLGTVVNDSITLKEVEAFEREQRERVAYGDGSPLSPGGQQGSKKEINPKMIYGKAQPQDRQRIKGTAKKLPMEVIDAEYQWDRRKLTFYFIAEKRIDF